MNGVILRLNALFCRNSVKDMLYVYDKYGQLCRGFDLKFR